METENEQGGLSKRDGLSTCDKLLRRDGLSKQGNGALSAPSAPLAIGALEEKLLALFPAEDAESWDRTGMAVGDPARLVEGVALALDPTVDAVRKAASCGANVLVTHHPAYLDPPDSFKPAASVAVNPGALVWAAIECGVAIMSFHTALDVSVHAACMLPGMLGLDFTGRVLEPVDEAGSKGYGQICSVRTTDEPFSLAQLAGRCTSVFGRAPRVWGSLSQELKTIVTCTGASASLAQKCVRNHIDCLVCGEVKYHDALACAQAGLAIIDLGHDVSELPFTVVLADAVRSVGVAGDCITVLNQKDNWSYPNACAL